MEQTAFEESYALLIKFLMTAKHCLIEIASEYELTGMQAMMLFLLDEPRPMFSFKKVFNCDASNVTGLVDGLEEKQLAARYADPTDRRVKMVKLSIKGQGLRGKLLRRLAGQNGSVLSRLSPEELEVFTALLMKITNQSEILVVE